MYHRKIVAAMRLLVLDLLVGLHHLKMLSSCFCLSKNEKFFFLVAYKFGLLCICHYILMF